MSTGFKIQLSGYRTDKTGKLVKSERKTSVSQKIAKRKKPKLTYRKAT